MTARAMRRVRGAYAGAVAVLAIAATARAEPPRGARWVGADATLYLEVTRPSAVLDQVLGEPFRAVAGAVPGVDKYAENNTFRTLQAAADVVVGRLDTTRDKALRDLTGGGIVLAVEAPRGERPRGFVVITPTDPAPMLRALDALIEVARKDAADKGRPDPITRGEHRGVGGYALGGKGALAIVEGSLVVADTPETLRAVIDRALDGGAIVDDALWKARRAEVAPEAVGWAFARLDRLRALDPKRFTLPEKLGPPPTFLFGSWLEAARKAPWASASLSWSDRRLAAELTLAAPEGGFGDAFAGFLPTKGAGAPGLVGPPGTIASLGLWRDLTAIWEARAELFAPEVVQRLAKLDTVAGQFFGGRDFGSGVLGALGTDWRLVVARQDEAGLDPAPDLKLPAVALIVDLKPDDGDFAQRLKVAFQSFVGLANLGAAQTQAPPLELGSETCDGVTILTSRFMKPKVPPADKGTEAVHYRHNYSPAAAQVGDRFILSSSVGLARDLIRVQKEPRKPEDATLVAEADGAELARLLERDRARLVMRDMLRKGLDKPAAEAGFDGLLGLVRYLGHARLTVRDGEGSDAVRLALDFALGDPGRDGKP
jgi:hypothetical protein